MGAPPLVRRGALGPAGDRAVLPQRDVKPAQLVRVGPARDRLPAGPAERQDHREGRRPRHPAHPRRPGRARRRRPALQPRRRLPALHRAPGGRPEGRAGRLPRVHERRLRHGRPRGPRPRVRREGLQRHTPPRAGHLARRLRRGGVLSARNCHPGPMRSTTSSPPSAAPRWWVCRRCRRPDVRLWAKLEHATRPARSGRAPRWRWSGAPSRRNTPPGYRWSSRPAATRYFPGDDARLAATVWSA